MPSGANISLLSWVKAEIDNALTVVQDNIARFSAAAGNVAALSACPVQLHQVSGALRIVGLHGATRFCETIEHTFTGITQNRAPDKAAIGTIGQAVLALKEFIDGLSRGDPNVPLSLFPIYRELVTIEGTAEVSEKDLFFPDLTLDVPPHPDRKTIASQELRAYLQSQRSRFQRGLLAWLRDPTNLHGLQEMRAVLDALDQIAPQSSMLHALWWAAVGLIDGLPHAPSREWTASAKSVCGKIDMLMRDLGAETREADEQLLCDILYLLARCPPATQRISEVRKIYQLGDFFSEPGISGVLEFDMDWLKPALGDIRSRLESIKNMWVQYTSGDPGNLIQFRALVTALKRKVGELGNQKLERLLDVIGLVATRLPDPYPQQSQMVIMEMASAFLLLENSIDNFANLPEDLDQQIILMGGWLLDAANDKSSGQPPAGLRAELSQQISKIHLQTQIAREIFNNLQHVEQVLDAFARGGIKHDELPPIFPHLRQIHGALVMLRYQRAADLVSACEEMVIACTKPAHPAAAEDVNWIAEGLSSLGFFLAPCLRGSAPAEEAIEVFFHRFENRTLEIPAEPAPGILVVVPEQAESPPAEGEIPPGVTMQCVEPVPVSQPDTATPSSAGEELLDIYLDEAGEVLKSIDETLLLCRQQPGNIEALRVIRRGFHTLKGSGRMVGLTELGEIAWEIERVLNLTLERQQTTNPLLLELIATASASFAHWVSQLKSRNELEIDARNILSLVQQLSTNAIPDAEAVNPEPEVVIGRVRMSRPFYDIYLQEAHQHLAALHTEFEAWHTRPGSDATHEFVLAAHTLASISRTSGLDMIADLAATLEQWLPHAHLPAALDGKQKVAAAIAKLEEMLSSISQQQLPDASISESHELLLEIKKLNSYPALSATATTTAAVTAPPCAAPLIAGATTATTAEPQDQRVIRDDLDYQLLPVFLEEAQALLPLISSDLREWKTSPDNQQISHSLKRALHTLKGSARMTGAMRLGELSHLMESRIEAALESSSSPTAALLEEFELQLDRLSAAIEQLHKGNQEGAPLQESQPLAHIANGVTSAHAAAQVELPVPGPAAMLRVNADTLDRLINKSGEVSIARARIEDELRTLKQSLLDLNESVMRLRGQLREVEIQADSQMQSRSSAPDAEKRDFDPLEFDRYTRLQELTRMMAESLHDVTTIQQTLLQNLGGADAALQQQARTNRDLQQEFMHMRTVPFSNLRERLYRIVRQSARELGKKVNLDIRGAQLELDRSVLEKISTPLEHILRNAVAHGIETPTQRSDCGKAEIGEITITLRQENREIVVIVNDDGAGLDFEKLRDRAREKGLPQAATDTPDSDLAQIIFMPGISTAGEITELSGRGVGMDVVRNEITAIGGRIETATTRAKGTTFTIYLPLTLAVAQAVLVRSGGETFAISAAMVEQVLRLKPEELSDCYERGTVASQDHLFPLHYLHHLLGSPPSGKTAEPRNHDPVLLLRSGTQRMALHVDEIVKNQEIVIKTAGPQLARIQGISGATVLGDGKIVLIINPIQLVQRARGPAKTVIAPAATSEPAARLIMVVDDSLTVRKVTGRLLEREGYRVLTAKDGVDALEQIKEAPPDIMLVDIEMPRMDGFDLTRSIRNDPRTAGVPIIMISSRTAEKHRNHAARLGVNAFLGKPYQEAELLQYISQSLNGKPSGVICH